MDVIDVILQSLRDQGLAIPPDAGKRAEIDARRHFGGERVYLKSLPKQRRALQVAQAHQSLGTAAVTLKRIAQASGIPVRTVKRLRTGR